MSSKALEGELLPAKPRGNKQNLTRMGKGRPKGALNKSSKEVKDNLLEVFERIGGVEGMAKWAMRNKTEFYKLYSKLLPIQLQGNGENGEFHFTITAEESKL